MRCVGIVGAFIIATCIVWGLLANATHTDGDKPTQRSEVSRPTKRYQGPAYREVVYDQTINSENISVMAITVVAAPALTDEQYDAIAKDVGGTVPGNGSVWVFDDQRAAELQWKSGLQWEKQPIDLSPEEDAYWGQHLKAQVAILHGQVR